MQYTYIVHTIRQQTRTGDAKNKHFLSWRKTKIIIYVFVSVQFLEELFTIIIRYYLVLFVHAKRITYIWYIKTMATFKINIRLTGITAQRADLFIFVYSSVMWYSSSWPSQFHKIMWIGNLCFPLHMHTGLLLWTEEKKTKLVLVISHSYYNLFAHLPARVTAGPANRHEKPNWRISDGVGSSDIWTICCVRCLLLYYFLCTASNRITRGLKKNASIKNWHRFVLIVFVK